MRTANTASTVTLAGVAAATIGLVREHGFLIAFIIAIAVTRHYDCSSETQNVTNEPRNRAARNRCSERPKPKTSAESDSLPAQRSAVVNPLSRPRGYPAGAAATALLSAETAFLANDCS